MSTTRYRRLFEQEVRLLDEINAFTLEVIARGFLGDYATEKILEDTARLFPILVGGIFSFPWTMPWPVNQFPLFAFGQSMEARSEFIAMLAEVVAERREDLASGRPIGNGGKSGGVVDLLLKAQQTQAEGRRANESGVTFDDEFIFDNVSAALKFAQCGTYICDFRTFTTWSVWDLSVLTPWITPAPVQGLHHTPYLRSQLAPALCVTRAPLAVTRLILYIISFLIR